MKTTWTYTTAVAVAGDAIYVACAADVYEDFARFTSLYQWDPVVAHELHTPNNWLYKNVDWRASSVTTLIPEQGDDWWLCALSEDGDVLLTGGGHSIEKIPGAGVHSDDAQGWGYLSDIQQIGEHLYAAGYSGQVYKRLGPNQWVHMDHGILQAAGLPGEQYSIQVINGPHEQAIYVAGCTNAPYYPARASFWNGTEWRDLQLPDVAERITNIHVESEERVWMVGANGTLLLGNAHDGFRSLSTVDDNQLFLSVCKYRERIVLGSNLGLFFYDPAAPDLGIRKLVTQLQPDVQDANIVDSVDDVLWSIGPKDIVRFDGQKWERIDHPDNPPIR
jgi:hypothetical protein